MRLPWDAPLLGNAEVADASKKLLKLHGCVTRPQSIVLTRQDYLRYGDQVPAKHAKHAKHAKPAKHAQTCPNMPYLPYLPCLRYGDQREAY